MIDDVLVCVFFKIDKKRDEKNIFLMYKLIFKMILKINYRDEFVWYIIILLNDFLRVVIDIFNLRLFCVIVMYVFDEFLLE